eukprot:2854565-Alexandrium_andersonii.AAC.1
MPRSRAAPDRPLCLRVLHMATQGRREPRPERSAGTRERHSPPRSTTSPWSSSESRWRLSPPS